LGVEGGDNQAINNLYKISDISGLTAGNLAVVVNVSEGGAASGDGNATLTALYLSLYNPTTGTTQYHEYLGPDLLMTDTGGIGQSGSYLFTLTPIQAAAALQFCPTPSDCLIGGGLQFASGSTSATPETMYITSYTPGTPVPEPFSLALVGAGLFGIGVARRARQR
jgi:hypothetical protein